MIGIALTVLRMIPGIGALISTITTKWMDTKAQMYAEKMGVTKVVATEILRAEIVNNQTKVGWLHAVAGSRFLQFIVGGFALPLIVHMNKAYVWDNVIHPIFWAGYGFTPPMSGYIMEWGGVIIGGIFVTATGTKIADAVLTKLDK
jgi:hypothetical protein